MLEVFIVFSVKSQILKHKNKWEWNDIFIYNLLIWHEWKGQEYCITGKIRKL